MDNQATMPPVQDEEKMMNKQQGHGMLSMDDPENPQNWPLMKKLHACLTAWTFTFVL